MIARVGCIVTLLALQLTGATKQELADEEKRVDLLNKIESMKSVYWQFQEHYRDVTENHWKQQQEQLRIKEEYKESMDALRQKQELLYNELARAKEEALVQENAVEEQQEALKEKTDLLDYLGKQVRDKITDEGKSVREGFPIDMELHVRDLNDIENQLSKGEPASKVLGQLLAKRLDWLEESRAASISRRTIVPDQGDPVDVEVIRIGNSLGYGLTPSGQAFLLSPNAKNRQFGFEWKAVKDPATCELLQKSFPGWLRSGKITGAMPLDVLQNATSGELFEGHKKSAAQRVIEYVKAGGPNILVLCAAGLLAFLLTLEKFFVLIRRATNTEKFVARFLTLTKDGNEERIERLLKKSHSTLARILRPLWRQRGASRDAAEKTLKEAFLKELPPLEKRLTLLAALGAAAPLLGLLGTVGGLITLFQVLNTTGTNDTRMLAGGISEALVNTETGLAVAIPVLLIHGYLSERAMLIQNTVQAAAAEVLNRLWPAAGSNQKDASCS